MKTRSKQLLLLLLLLSCVLGKAQDRLGFCPLKNAKELFDDYDERLEQILHHNLSEDYLARCVFIPSFEPEWALQIEKDAESGNCQICALTFEKNLWYQKEDEVGVSKKTMLIDCLKSQDTVPPWNLITIVESMPSFDNDKDYDKLSEIIQSNLIGLDTITICKTIYIELLVDTIGNTHNHKVLTPTNSMLDREALRVCRLIKFDHPAMQRGHPVSIKYVVPVRFEPKRTTRQKPRHCIFKH